MEEVFIDKKIIYAGRRETTSGKIVHSYYVVEKDWDVNKFIERENSWLFDTKIFKRDRIGNVYNCKVFEGRIKYTATSLPIAYWLNSENTIEWKAFDIAMDEKKKLKEGSTRNAIEAALKDVKFAYRRSDTQGRVQILAEIIRIVTG